MADFNEHKFLTKEKILQILKAHEKTDEVSLTDTSLKLGTEKGENYSGELIACDIKARVKGQDREYHWMVKMPPPGGNKHSFSSLAKMQEKESLFYGSFLPKLEKFIADRGADIKMNFCPVLLTEYHDDLDKGSFIVMENLQYLGYRDAVNKKKGLSLAHAKMAVEEMAKLHAAGYAYLQSFPGGNEEGLAENRLLTRDFMFTEPEEPMRKMMEALQTSYQDSLYDMVAVCQEPGQDFISLLKDFHAKCEGGMMGYRDRLLTQDTGFKVFRHGDAWFNNMMFKYGSDGQTPDKICLVDMALTSFGNPCADLSYFLCTSTTPQLKRTHLEDILECYHNCLISCLHKLGVDPNVYPYRRFRQDYKKFYCYGFISTLGMLPTILVKKEDAMGAEEVREILDAGSQVSPERMKEMNDAMLKAYAKEPQVKIMMAGNIFDFMDNENLTL